MRVVDSPLPLLLEILVTYAQTQPFFLDACPRLFRRISRRQQGYFPSAKVYLPDFRAKSKMLSQVSCLYHMRCRILEGNNISGRDQLSELQT